MLIIPGASPTGFGCSCGHNGGTGRRLRRFVEFFLPDVYLELRRFAFVSHGNGKTAAALVQASRAASKALGDRLHGSIVVLRFHHKSSCIECRADGVARLFRRFGHAQRDDLRRLLFANRQQYRIALLQHRVLRRLLHHNIAAAFDLALPHLNLYLEAKLSENRLRTLLRNMQHAGHGHALRIIRRTLFRSCADDDFNGSPDRRQCAGTHRLRQHHVLWNGFRWFAVRNSQG